MAGLFDGVEPPAGGCKVAQFDLDEEDRAALESHLKERTLTLLVIQGVLRRQGFEVGQNLLAKHRSNQCVCAR